MKKTYIFGHINPDTDSVAAAISLSYLKNKQNQNTEPKILGNINNETNFVLNYFKFKKPALLNDVKLQIKDLNYRKNLFLKEDTSIIEVYNYMQKENTTGVPIVDKKNKLINLITSKDLLKSVIHSNNLLDTNYDNILETINGTEIVRASKEVKGNVTAVSLSHKTFEEKISLTRDDIIIVGDRDYIIELGILSKVKLMILVKDQTIKPELIELAKQNKVNVITTTFNTYETVNSIFYSNYISLIHNKEYPTTVNENDYCDDFELKSSQLKVDNFPIIDNNNKCIGLLRKSEINKSNKKQVILVDHNEIKQSVLGLDEANIVEIVDHHKIGNLNTNYPINIRNMAVGSSNTIIYLLYKENNIEIPHPIAGLMLSAIISDTLLFNSPTTTEIDKIVADELNKICKLDIEKFAKEMFDKGSSLKGKSTLDILNGDMKIFTVNEQTIAISQITTTSSNNILKNKEEYLLKMNELKQKNNYDKIMFCVTDVLEKGSYLLFNEECNQMIKESYNIKNGEFVENLMSRKKQIVPKLIELIENK